MVDKFMKLVYQLNLIMETQNNNISFLSNNFFLVFHGIHRQLFDELSLELEKEFLNFSHALILIRLNEENLKGQPASVSASESADAELTPKDLAKALLVTKGNISHCLNHLEFHKLIIRKINNQDGRGQRIRLSQKGRRLSLWCQTLLTDQEKKCYYLLQQKK
jgi:DNA-binding MarR family transcriptional regulator